MIELHEMIKDEYEAFCKLTLADHVRELTEVEGKTPEEAKRQALEEFNEVLPDGLDTPENFVMLIKSDGVDVGYIWTYHELCDGKKQSFICDFLIYEAQRRNGYGAEALRVMEEKARNAGCVESVLFVEDKNARAIRLYEKCGYVFLRKMEYGMYMKKVISA